MSSTTTVAKSDSVASPPTTTSSKAPSPSTHARSHGNHVRNHDNTNGDQKTSPTFNVEHGTVRHHENLTRTTYHLADAIYQNASQADLDSFGSAEERCTMLGLFAYQLMEVANITRIHKGIVFRAAGINKQGYGKPMKLALAIARSNIAQREELRAAQQAQALVDGTMNMNISDNNNHGGAGGHNKENANPAGHNAQREQLQLPTQPPYTAHIGNMAFDTTLADVNDFFKGHQLEVANIRIVEDNFTKKAKGFGYVEFADLEGVKKALELTGSSLGGRVIRISVAAPKHSVAYAKDIAGPLATVDPNTDSAKSTTVLNGAAVNVAAITGAAKDAFNSAAVGAASQKVAAPATNAE